MEPRNVDASPSYCVIEAVLVNVSENELDNGEVGIEASLVLVIEDGDAVTILEDPIEFEVEDEIIAVESDTRIKEVNEVSSPVTVLTTLPPAICVVVVLSVIELALVLKSTGLVAFIDDEVLVLSNMATDDK
ncbi:hypothetical protein WICMUC_002878 [Wickerhamomyces mucosus]|uniref:Uncharacterized protein n=1 Tax=Wickerhamomyces mucosus TaxID=1378264 RepID=A0A9P8TDE9_9ASCO|nr:hypothetical protein WICMUC_002878 [Wickerhamomyces mucosus]